MTPFRYARTIHFADTDAAGIVFFARYLNIAHEAYEEALGTAGIPLGDFFRDNGVIIPIAKSEAAYLRPLTAGEKIIVEVSAERTSDYGYALDTIIWKPGPPKKRAAVIHTEHVCIDSASRAKITLPDSLLRWIEGA